MKFLLLTVTWIKVPEIPGLETDNAHVYFRISNNHNLIFRGIDSWEGKSCLSLRDEKMDYLIKNGAVSEAFPRIKESSLAELNELEQKNRMTNFLELIQTNAAFRKEVEADLGIDKELIVKEFGNKADRISGSGNCESMERKLDLILEMLRTDSADNRIGSMIEQKMEGSEDKTESGPILVRVDESKPMTLAEAAKLINISQNWIYRKLKQADIVWIKRHRIMRYG